ncbi:MAG: glycosyltransferase [Candidatus Omnitrophica bacterium]|nr:glycosyltransferase [Candidatus Omnitrophota bacterium]
MRIIVVYASAGKGHTRAAEAIYGYLKECRPDCNPEILDILDKSSLLFRASYHWGYSLLVNRAQFLWRISFWVTHTKALRFITRAISLFLNKLDTKRFAAYLIKENFDVVISTHFLPSEICAYLKAKGKIKARLVTVITDFGVHDFWRCAQTDLYVVASEFTKAKLLSENVSHKRIKVLGLPADKRFSGVFNREASAKELGLDSSKFTILICTGSFGIGGIEKVVEELLGQAQILVVTANNKSLYARLLARKLPGVSVYSFVNNIEKLMAVSDIMIAKPGGMTIAECLAMEIIPLFITAIYGQELENIKVLRLLKIGVDCRGLSPREIKEIILDLKTHPEKLDALKANHKKLNRRFLVEEFCDAVC